MFYSKVSRQLRVTESFAYFLSFQIPFDGFLPVITREVISVNTPKYFTWITNGIYHPFSERWTGTGPVREKYVTSVLSLLTFVFYRSHHDSTDVRHTEYVFWFSQQILSETIHSLSRYERDIIKNVYWSSCKVPAIFVRF